MEFLCQKYTLEYYAKYIEDYRAGLSSIEFAQLELDKNRKKLQLEIEYVNPNAIIKRFSQIFYTDELISISITKQKSVHFRSHNTEHLKILPAYTIR